LVANPSVVADIDTLALICSVVYMQENLKALQFAVSLTISNRAAEVLRETWRLVRAMVLIGPGVIQIAEEVLPSVKIAAALIKETFGPDILAAVTKHAIFRLPGLPDAAADLTPPEPPRSSSIIATSTFADVEDIIGEERDERLDLAEQLGLPERVRSSRAVCCGAVRIRHHT
jgi:hypothetical protein